MTTGIPPGSPPEPTPEAPEPLGVEPGTPTEFARTRHSGLVGAGILSSRLTGLVRERVFAHFFGATSLADAWGAALRMPNVVQNLLGEGTLSASFIPIYAELREEGRHAEAARFAGAVFGIVGVTAAGAALLGMAFAPWLVGFFFYGFDPETRAVTVGLVRILFPMTAVLVLSAWALGVLNSHRRFFLSYVAPVAWNAAMIAALLWGGISLGLELEALARFLAWGALLGGVFQLGVQLPTTLRLLGEFRPSLSTRVGGVREAIRNFIPVVTARGVVNLSGWLDYALAAFLAVGAVATLRYAQTLYILPISLFGMAVAASELPELSRMRDGGRERIAGDLARATRRMAFFLVPSTAAFLLFGDVVIAAIFRTGAFGVAEVTVTWGILAAYALGIPASATSRLYSSGFYALRNTRTPAKIAGLRVFLALAVGASLMFPLDRYGVGELRFGAAGLALGSTVAAWTEYLLLRRALRRELGDLPPDPDAPPGASTRLWLAAGVGAGVGYLAGILTLEMHPILRAVPVLGGMGVGYLAAAMALGVAGPVRALLPRRGSGR